MKEIRFLDLFAGISGIRIGFETACARYGLTPACVFTSEIKPDAVTVHQQNYPKEEVAGDITQIAAGDIPDCDFLLAGFPCQAFSMAGKRLGFLDTRGTLFFEVERILRAKNPFGFLLENVEGLVHHDQEHRGDPTGRTLATILARLDDAGYQVAWRVLNAKDFGVPQNRKRIYIVGTREKTPDLDGFIPQKVVLGDILEHGLPVSTSPFVRKLLAHYRPNELCGKAVKDKRGGRNNIHSWDIDLKGPVSTTQRNLLNRMVTERRRKKWASVYGIDWMDGMPLTLEMIRTFFDADNLEEMLDDLVKKGYLVLEHPKRRVGHSRIRDENLPRGYNIVAGKMSFEVSEVLNPSATAPTLTAMDMQHLFVRDGDGIRSLTLREGLRLFGYPETMRFNVPLQDGYNLLGNTVVVPVIAAVAGRLLDVWQEYYGKESQS